MEDERDLLAEQSDNSEDNGEVILKARNSKPPVVVPVTVNKNVPSKRHIADLPYSVEDPSVSHSVSQVLSPQQPRSHHYPQRRPPRKSFTITRWTCGIALILCLIVLSIVGVYLVYSSPDFDKPPWWTSAIVYQCYPQSFQDSNGDGFGDLNGIRSRSSYFSDIGVQAVWLNPIFESPQKDNGYDVSNYTAIYSKYGTLEDFQKLLEDLHKEGIRLLLDFVPNHTSDQHPWFKDSRSSKNSPKRDWYIWANGRGQAPPNNWISVFGGSAWTYDNITEQWYLHQFSSFQPDLNYRNPEVMGNMSNVLEFWLDLGVDGFRVDAVKFLLEDPKLQNESPSLSFNNTATCITNVSDPICYNSLIHNLTTDYPGIHSIIKHWKTIIDHYSETSTEPKLLIGEIYDDIDKVMEYYGTNGDEFSFPFNFFLLDNNEWTGTSVACIIAEWINNLPGAGNMPNWVLGNHDNPRIASKAGVHLARALNVLLLTLPGAVTTYYGEELMMTDVAIPPDKQRDPYYNRDPERTPMQWNYTQNAGFTTSHTPWLPVAANYSSVNVQVQSSPVNETSMIHLYKKLASLKASEEVLREGRYTCINATDELLIYARDLTQDESVKKVFVVAINFASRNVTTNISIGLSNTEIVLSSLLDKTGKIDLRNVTLQGGEGLVVMGTQSSSTGSCQKTQQLNTNNECNFCTKKNAR